VAEAVRIAATKRTFREDMGHSLKHQQLVGCGSGLR